MKNKGLLFKKAITEFENVYVQRGLGGNVYPCLTPLTSFIPSWGFVSSLTSFSLYSHHLAPLTSFSPNRTYLVPLTSFSPNLTYLAPLTSLSPNWGLISFLWSESRSCLHSSAISTTHCSCSRSTSERIEVDAARNSWRVCWGIEETWGCMYGIGTTI